MNTALEALIILNGLLASASNISKIIENAQSEGRSVLTKEEWDLIIGNDDAARQVLADAILKASGNEKD